MNDGLSVTALAASIASYSACTFSWYAPSAVIQLTCCTCQP